jgi:uncharacterized protein YjiS (DUF1127 family)
LHCSASIQTHFFDDSAYCRRKTEVTLQPIIRFIQHWKRYGRVVQELSRLSERELADIGIARCDIDRIARGQFRQ